MGWLITLGILLFLAVMPLGVILVFGADGLNLRIIAGPVRFALLPKKKKKKEKFSPKKADHKAFSRKPADKKEEIQEDKGGSVLDFLPLLKLAVEFLGGFRRKLRVRRLILKVTMAGDDPCDLAVNYGKAWAALGNVMPLLDRIFVIGKRDLQIQCDFTQEDTRIFAHGHITITLGRLLTLVTVYGVRALAVYLKISNKRKGGK